MRQLIGNSNVGPGVLVFIAAGLWGLYWLPLRNIESTGISPGWAVIAVYLVPFLFLIPFAALRFSSIRTHWFAMTVIALPVGAGLACYATAFLYTTVMRTTLLFYLTPVWSTLLAIIFLNEKTGLRRWLAIGIGFSGLAIMVVDTGNNSTVSDFNRGDLAAILAGMLWGFGTVMLRKTPHLPAFDLVPLQYFFALLVSGVFLWVYPGIETASVPTTQQWLAAMPSLFIFYVLIMLPSLYICIRCAQILSPGRVGILMMSEVLVAGISATWLAGESLTAREVLATALILCAGVMEVTTPE